MCDFFKKHKGMEKKVILIAYAIYFLNKLITIQKHEKNMGFELKIKEEI